MGHFAKEGNLLHIASPTKQLQSINIKTGKYGGAKGTVKNIVESVTCNPNTIVRFVRISDTDIDVYYDNSKAYTIEITNSYNMCLGANHSVVALWNIQILGYKINGENISSTVNNESLEEDTSGKSPHIVGLFGDKFTKIPLSQFIQTSFYPYLGKTIYLLGDSIFSADYIWNKQALNELTKAEVYNAGYPGWTAQMIASNKAFERLISYNPDLIIMMVGGNNSGEKGTIGTFSSESELAKLGESVISESDINSDFFTKGSGQPTYVDSDYQCDGKFIAAVSHTIRRIRDLYYNFRYAANINAELKKKDGSESAIFSGTEMECAEYAKSNSIDMEVYMIKPTDSEDVKTEKLNSVKKPQLIVCTPLPQKRYSNDSVWSKQENWERKRLAVIECCEKYGVPMIDLMNEFKIDWIKEPFYPGSDYSSTNRTDNQGIYTMDGLHPNRYGYSLMMSIINRYITTLYNPLLTFLK